LPTAVGPEGGGEADGLGLGVEEPVRGCPGESSPATPRGPGEGLKPQFLARPRERAHRDEPVGIRGEGSQVLGRGSPGDITRPGSTGRPGRGAPSTPVAKREDRFDCIMVEDFSVIPSRVARRRFASPRHRSLGGLGLGSPRCAPRGHVFSP